MTQIALASAYLCAECSTVGDSAMQCPACGAQHGLLSLACGLDREPPPSLDRRILDACARLDEVLQ